MEDFGSPNFGYLDGAAQSFRSNQFRPPSPINKPQQTTRSTDGPPILKRHKVEFTPDEAITHLAAGLNQVAIATRDKKIIIIDTAQDKQQDCDLSRFLGARLAQARINKLFMDPTGTFTLICLAFAADGQPMENLLYVKRLQSLARLKNHIITAVAWNNPKNNSTGAILLGTSKGLVLQTEFNHADETKFFPLNTGPTQYVKEVFDVGTDIGAITGIQCHPIPSNSVNEKSFIIFVSTNNRLYRMVGSVAAGVEPPPLHLIFGQNSSNYHEVPGRLNYANLDIYYMQSVPVRFGWLTEPGVVTGEINIHKTTFDDDDINIVPHSRSRDTEVPMSSSTSPPINSMVANFFEKPIAVAVTNFHVVVLFRNSIRAICVLNDATVYEEYFSNRYGNVQGMAKDQIKNIIWIYFEKGVFRYKVVNENKNIWKIYLDQKRFDLAKKYSLNNQANFDRVICEEAQHYFKLKEYERSAEIFARSMKPFEDVSLMFMEIKCTKALKKYLMIKLELFEPAQRTQMTMTLAWLIEIIISSISVVQTLPQTDTNANELDELYLELEQLLENKQIVDCLKEHTKLFYGIIRSYSDLETFVRVAKLIGDYEHVISYYIDLRKFDKALEMMRIVKRDEFYYQYGHILMKMMPRELVDGLMEQPNIDPSKLIPVLIQENPYFNKCSETIRYLEFCIKTLKTESRVIHNYLFELYARHKDEKTLIEYLEEELVVNSDGTQTCYLDLQLCLRLSTELKLLKTSVTLYSSMDLFDEALNLALTFDVNMAKTIANKPESDDHQKRLWLTIAQKILTDNLNIQMATSLLRECRLLKIEDILPFFPDYTTIDFLKDAVRLSLQEYRDQIMLLKDGTFDCIAEEIRAEIKAFRNRYSIIKYGQRCEICSRNLLSRSFYLFPCGHLFHSDCIMKEIIAIDPNYKGIEEKLNQLTMDQPKTGYPRSQNIFLNSISSQTKSTAPDNRERLMNELNEIISSECVYCGSILPTYIDKPPLVFPDQLKVDGCY